MPPFWMLQRLEDRTQRRDQQATRPRPSTAPQGVAAIRHATGTSPGQNVVPVPGRCLHRATQTTPPPIYLGPHGMRKNTVPTAVQNTLTPMGQTVVTGGGGQNVAATSRQSITQTAAPSSVRNTQSQSQHKKVDSGVTVGLQTSSTRNSANHTHHDGKTPSCDRDQTIDDFVDEDQLIPDDVEQETVGRWRRMWRKLKRSVRRNQYGRGYVRERPKDEDQTRLLGWRWP